MIAHLLKLAKGSAGLLGLSALARTLTLLCGAALLVFPAWLVGRLADDQDIPPLGTVIAVMIGLAAAKGLTRYAEQLSGHTAAFALLEQLRVRLYEKLIPLAPAVTASRGSGRLLSAATRDVDRVEVFFAHTLAPVVTAVLIPAAAVVLTWSLTGSALGGALLVIYLTAAATLIGIGRRGGRATSTAQVRARGALAQEISDDLRGREEITIFGAQEQRAQRVDRLGAQIGAGSRGASVLLGLRAAAGQGWQVLALFVLLLLGLPQAQDGVIGYTELLLVLALVPGTAPALAAIEALGISLPAALASAANLRELEESAPEVTEPTSPVEVRTEQDGAASVSFRAVSFGYPGTEREVLHDVDLHIEPGQVAAVVGVSGSGKSTLASLLARVWDPQAGQVRLGGTDVRDLSLASLRAHITVVEQRPVMISGSIRENLVLGSPGATEDQILAACRSACLAADIDAMPQGLDTQLGAEGARLSGGQAQRLALARGYLRRSPVLILDEITSAQDPLTQAEILRRMPEATSATVIMIAHRSAVLRHVDAVYEIDAGKIRAAALPAAGA
ncbi:amino acid ABC transporter ATP-binding/permease protein [Nesterenkonia sandarakina]|uniref:ABC-type multidrug transport system fused ATPase/permease subunit n=1 Tax=Nesterenkonia sandarakina TaxID=272918 RepID=A0A2T0YIX1_9MICC|nr:ABC transporter ATP-binding protein [Nesterenkonia sandarakina]PRZ15118.1 ABC-type multidrug transport system fused ATPase/permease subunit [Nesterenkonia sandarakina]